MKTRRISPDARKKKKNAKDKVISEINAAKPEIEEAKRLYLDSYGLDTIVRDGNPSFLDTYPRTLEFSPNAGVFQFHMPKEALSRLISDDRFGGLYIDIPDCAALNTRLRIDFSKIYYSFKKTVSNSQFSGSNLLDIVISGRFLYHNHPINITENYITGFGPFLQVRDATRQRHPEVDFRELPQEFDVSFIFSLDLPQSSSLGQQGLASLESWNLLHNPRTPWYKFFNRLKPRFTKDVDEVAEVLGYKDIIHLTWNMEEYKDLFESSRQQVITKLEELIRINNGTVAINQEKSPDANLHLISLNDLQDGLRKLDPFYIEVARGVYLHKRLDLNLQPSPIFGHPGGNILGDKESECKVLEGWHDMKWFVKLDDRKTYGYLGTNYSY